MAAEIEDSQRTTDAVREWSDEGLENYFGSKSHAAASTARIARTRLLRGTGRANVAAAPRVPIEVAPSRSLSCMGPSVGAAPTMEYTSIRIAAA